MDNPVQILVVDDEPRLLRGALRLLEQANYEVLRAATSREGLQLAIEHRPDLILLSIVLPDEDGFTLCQSVKAEPALANSTVALLSRSRTGSEEEARALEAGADEFVTCPISDHELLARVQGMVRVKRMQDELRERVKELDCLYSIGALLEKPGITLDEILQRTVELVPPAWQYPDVTVARLVLEDQEFVAGSFQETAWSQACDIVANGELLGRLQVCYLEQRPERDEGPFLREERKLLEAIAEQLGGIIERHQAQAALEASEQKYRDLVEDINEVIYSLDLDGVLTYIGPGVESLLGRSPSEITGHHFQEFIHSEDLVSIGQAFQRVLSGQNAANEYRVVTMSGDVRWIRTSSRPVIREGQVIGVQGTLANVTERKRHEMALLESEARYRSLFEDTPIGLYSSTSDGQLIAANPAMLEMLAYPNFETLLQVNAADLYVDPEDRTRWQTAMEQGDGLLRDFEVRLCRHDGRVIWARETARAARDDDGQILRYDGALEDITERKRTEEALRESAAMLDKSQAIAHVGSWKLDLVANRLTWSDEVYRMFGVHPQEFGGTYEAFLDMVHPDDRAAVDASYTGSLRKGRDTYEIEHRIVRRDSGEVRVVHEKCEHVRDASGRTVRSVGMVQDITERRKAEDQIRILSEAMAQSPSIVLLTDLEGNIEYVNRRFTEITGYCAEEVIGQTPRILKSSHHPAAYYEELWETILSGGQWRGELVNRKKSGELYCELASISPLARNDGVATHFIKVANDITHRVQIEEMLRRRTAQLEGLRQINLGLSAQLDLHDLLHSITENAVQLLGATAGGFYRHRPELDLLEWVVSVGPYASPIGTLVRKGEGLSGRVWLTGAPLLVDEYQQWAGRLVTSPVHAWGSVLGVPVCYGREADGEEFLGVLNVMVEDPRRFSPEDSELLNLFASQVAVAIRNAQLYELAQRKIAESEQAQVELRRERDLVASIMENSPMGIIVLDRQGKIVYANPQVARIAETELESLLLRSYDDLDWHVVDENGQPLPHAQQPFARVLETGEPVLGEHLNIEAEGGHKWHWSVSVTPLMDESGEINRLVAVVEDITARLQAERALRDSEKRYRTLVETSPDAITLTDLEGNILACNQYMAELHGFENMAAVIGTNVLDLFPPEELQRARENRQKALTEGIVRDCECVLLKKDGSRFPAELSTSAFFDESGRPQALIGVTRDITERVQSHSALRESQERLKSTLSSMDDLVFVLDRRCAFIDYHRPEPSSELYAPPEVFLGKTVQEVLPPDVAEPLQEAFEAVVATGESQQFDYPLHLGGEQQWFSARISMRVDSEGEFAGVTAVCRNITNRKRAEQALEQRNRVLEVLNRISEEVWSTLEMGPMLDAVVRVAVQAIDATSGYICDWDEEQRTTTCLAEYHGPDASEAERISDVGVTYHMEQELGDPSDWLYSSEAYHVGHVDDPHISPKEQAFMTEFGVASMLNVPLKVRDKPFGYIELWDSRHQRVFSAEEIDLILAISRQVSMGIENAQLHQQAQQEVAERKRTEKRIQASLNEKEILLKEIHHRVKNNLQVISSLLDMQALYTHRPEVIEALEDSRHRIRAMAFVHERLYQSEDLTNIGVEEYVRSMVGHLSAAYEGRARGADVHLQIDRLSLDLDTAIACGLLINELVSNALKHAFPTGWEGAGEICVALRSLGDGCLELRVSDNGVGLPPGLDPEESTSLGLRLVHMLTQQLRGTLELDSQAGTAVTITFADPGWSTSEEEA